MTERRPTLCPRPSGSQLCFSVRMQEVAQPCHRVHTHAAHACAHTHTCAHAHCRISVSRHCSHVPLTPTSSAVGRGLGHESPGKAPGRRFPCCLLLTPSAVGRGVWRSVETLHTPAMSPGRSGHVATGKGHGVLPGPRQKRQWPRAGWLGVSLSGHLGFSAALCYGSRGFPDWSRASRHPPDVTRPGSRRTGIVVVHSTRTLISDGSDPGEHKIAKPRGAWRSDPVGWAASADRSPRSVSGG